MRSCQRGVLLKYLSLLSNSWMCWNSTVDLSAPRSAFLYTQFIWAMWRLSSASGRNLVSPSAGLSLPSTCIFTCSFATSCWIHWSCTGHALSYQRSLSDRQSQARHWCHSEPMVSEQFRGPHPYSSSGMHVAHTCSLYKVPIQLD